MLRVPRDKLNQAVESLLIASHSCTDIGGLKVINHPDPALAERAILSALSVVAPNGGPVTPSDVYYISGYGTDHAVVWPPEKIPK